MSSARRFLPALVIAFLLVIAYLAFQVRDRQEAAFKNERLAQQIAMFGSAIVLGSTPSSPPPPVRRGGNRNNVSSSSNAVGDELPPETPSPDGFARENRHHFVGAPRVKDTPHCRGQADAGKPRKRGAGVDFARTALVRASPFKQSPMCYYTACHFCVTDGALEFFAPRSGAVVLDDAMTPAPTRERFSITTTNAPRHGNSKRGKTAADSAQAASALHDVGLKSRAEINDLPPLRLCNELRPKIQLPVFNAEDVRRLNDSAALPNQHNAALHRELSFLRARPADADWIEDRAAHVVACWQFYGYHLFQCSVAAYYAEMLFANELKSGDGGSGLTNHINGSSNRDRKEDGEPRPTQHHPPFDLYLYNHAVTMSRAMREHYSHGMYVGSRKSWLNPVRESLQPSLLTEEEQQDERDVRPAAWWGMWAVNALGGDDGASVSPLNNSNSSSSSGSGADRVEQLFRFPRRGSRTKRRMCYRRGIIGQPVHRVVPTAVRHRHVDALRAAFGAPQPIALELPPAGEPQRRPDFTKDPACLVPTLFAGKSNSSADNGGFVSVAQVPVYVVICQRGAGRRQGSRRIQNVEAVVNAVEGVFRGQGHLWSTNNDETGGGVVVAAAAATARGNDLLPASHEQQAANAEEEGEDAVAAVADAMRGTKRQFQQRLQQMMRGPAAAQSSAAPSPAAADDPHRQLLSERLSALDAQTQRLISRTALHVEVVDFATLPFDEQVRLASRADVWISTHGAGNVWTAFMPRGRSVFVELWPGDFVARDVYRAMAAQYDIKYVPVFAKMRPLGAPGSREAAMSFLHQDVRVRVDDFAKILQAEVAPFVLRATRCAKTR